MMKYEDFKEYIETIKEHNSKERKFAKDMQKYFDGNGIILKNSDKLLSKYINLLEYVFQDKEDSSGYSDITWWLFEKNGIYGVDSKEFKKKSDLSIIVNKVEYKLNSIKELYDFLLEK